MKHQPTLYDEARAYLLNRRAKRAFTLAAIALAIIAGAIAWLGIEPIAAGLGLASYASAIVAVAIHLDR